MKGLDKKTCREFLEPLTAPSSDCGLFLIEKLEYIIRTAVKIIGRRRLLVLCLYARGETPGGRPKLAYTMFQSSDSFITYDHQADTKTVWRTAMLENLERDYYFLKNGCAFYSRPDETRVINFCRPYVKASDCCETGFSALSKMQHKLRDKATLLRQKARERKIRARLSGLTPLPQDLESWLRRQVLPAYFFYDYRKGAKSIQGLCSACGQTVEMPGARHNAKGVCPNCGRELTMKSNGKCGYLWDRVTASVVQRFHGGLIIRIVKAYQNFRKSSPAELNCYEETRIIVTCQENGRAMSEVYHHSGDSVGITRWKKGYPPASYMFQQNFNADTCGALYCKNLFRVLKGTPWQYSQLEAFYRASHENMEVLPYLEAYREIPAIEFFVKLGLSWLAAHVAYRHDGKRVINPNGKNLREILQINPRYLSWLQRPGACVRDLLLLRILQSAGHQPNTELFDWLNANKITEVEQLTLALRNTTPHKLMRYLDQLFSKLGERSYRGSAGVLSDYSDYLGFCARLNYDLKNEFVLFPKNFKRAHDQANELVKQRRVEQFDPKIAAMQKDLKRRYQFQSDGLVVLPPHSAQEIVVEGQKLHHCVGGYAQSMAEQRCVILFIRREEKRSKPFYTVEVKGNEIRQVRGSNNRAPVPEVEAFLDKWKKKKHLSDAA